MANVYWTHNGLGRKKPRVEGKPTEYERVLHLPVEVLKDRGVYRVVCRNFGLGVYNAKTHEFLGVRKKFGSRFVFGEYHWDTGMDGTGAYGTALPVRLLDVELPAGIPAVEMLEGSVERTSGRACWFDETPDEKGEYLKDHKAVTGWRFTDTNEKFDFDKHVACYRPNDELLAWLEALEKKLDETTPGWRTEE
jgi:hypothetical protein